AQILNEGHVKQVDSSKCLFPKTKERRIVCAGGMESKQSSCQGDSGSGIFRKYKKNFYLMGVTSVGPPDCSPDTPDSYTDIYGYQNWIKQYVKELPTI
ncbi:melanization protease 1, partial [Nephila pilipes]